ncbi:zinc-ribbon domain-containing protein [Pseudobutyrivibrio xylanivorans]|uniref:CapR homology domain-containing protein n=1 Tax=Pseudobutyrivibrio xylanivorans TaxID=185007 RepID=A0A5P6VQ15_PSEXY|nr:hypothetical protein [Pseudobutyrivibrio xylanivorans]QFJ53779.1 hypothetical protein FXF36_02285 [Pseudobutyrivibrio xylanivorans]
MKIITQEEFIEKLANVTQNILVIGKYTGARNKISVKCVNCGHIWEATPTNLLKGRGCPKCSYAARGLKHRVNATDYINKLKENNPNVEVIGKYVNSNTKVLARCSICQNQWMVLPSSLKRGSGCPRCAHTGTSFVEQIFFLSLMQICDENLLSRDRTAIDLELDIYSPSQKWAVEYGAWPWHKNKTEKDIEKIKRCNAKNIKLIEIFDACEKDEQTNNVWKYTANFGRKENIGLVKDVLIKLCDALGVTYSLSDKDFYNICEEARTNASTLTKDRLNEMIERRDIPVKILTDYKDMLTKVRAKCLICGHNWDVIPASILRGLGCPKCAIKRRSEKQRKSHEQLLRELEEKNPNIKLLGDYVGNHTPIKAMCKKHGVIWETTPGSLLRGSGCKICRQERIAKSQRISTEEFKRIVEDKNPNLIILGKYQNNRTKIKVKCKRCNTISHTLPYTILNGIGCSKCGREAQANTRRKSTESFIQELYNVNENIEVIGEYTKSSDNISVRCKKCGFVWNPEASSLLLGFGCPKCAGNKRKTHEEFLSEIKNKNINVEVLGKYVNAKTKLKVRCLKCNNTWDITPTNLLSGKRCPVCRKVHPAVNGVNQKI